MKLEALQEQAPSDLEYQNTDILPDPKEFLKKVKGTLCDGSLNNFHEEYVWNEI